MRKRGLLFWLSIILLGYGCSDDKNLEQQGVGAKFTVDTVLEDGGQNSFNKTREMNSYMNGDGSGIMISPNIAEQLQNGDENVVLHVVMAFEDGPKQEDFILEKDPVEYGISIIENINNLSYDYIDGKYYINGHLDEGEVAEELTKVISLRNKQLTDNYIRLKTQIVDEITNLGVSLSKDVIDEYINGNHSLQTYITISDIHKLLNHSKLIGIENVKESSSSSLSSAMLATHYTSYHQTHPNENLGDGVAVYISEEKCPNVGYLNNYTLLGSNNNNNPDDLKHGRNVASILRTLSPNHYMYCRAGCVLPLLVGPSTEIYSFEHTVRVLSFSCGYYNYPDNESLYSTIDRDIDNYVYRFNVSAVVAAGNNDAILGNNIKGLGKGFNVITVGNYNDSNNTPPFVINNSSNYIDPNTKNNKPEISAPGTNINAGYDLNGNPITLTGTSQAAPQVSAMIANLASHFTNPNRATAMMSKALLLLSAETSVTGGFDKVGYGGVDYELFRMASGFGLKEGDFNDMDANDPYPNNGAFDININISGLNHDLRFALAWTNSGDYIYSHTYFYHPIGNNFKIQIYSPSGSLLYTETNEYNGFIVFEHHLNQSGSYHIKITKIHEDGTGFDRLGYAYKKYNASTN